MSPTPDSVGQLLASSDLGDRLRAVNQMRELDPAIAFEMIQTACKDSNPRVRYAAISQMDTLGGQGRQVALEILREALLNDPEPDVQAAAADAIGGLQLTEAYEDLKSLYESTGEWLIQLSIIAALGELGEPRAFDLLVLALKSEIQLVANAAIGALGELGDERAVPLLLEYVEADDWQVRHRVTQALGQFKVPEARSALDILSQDSAAAVADTARYYTAH